MKVIQTINQEDPALSRTVLELEGDTVIKSAFFDYKVGNKSGELILPEGLLEIENGAFNWRFGYHTVYFPRSLKKLGRNIFHFDVRVVYAGSSADFIALAAPEKVEKYESDGFDHYPYYSESSRFVTYYYAFDRDADKIEVECLQDGVTLLYGRSYRKEDGAPKTKA